MIPEALLEIEDLHVSFKVFNGIAEVINGVNIKVGYSERVGIVGETGCGKTTTMRAVMRTLSDNAVITHQSKIFFKGKNILEMNQSEMQEIRRNKISMVFEDPNTSLNPVFSVGTQLNDIVRSIGVKDEKNSTGEKSKKENSKQKIMQVLKDVYLPDQERIYRSYPIQLSGGMRQRIGIAMALITQKELLIFDEPGTSLDVTIKYQIFELIGKIIKKENSSIILISHNLGDIRHMTDRAYVMYAGSVAEEAKTKELFDKPLHPYSKGLLLATPRLTGGIGEGIFGNIPSYVNPLKGCRFYPRCEYKMPICQETMPPLINIDNSHKVACFLFKNKKEVI